LVQHLIHDVDAVLDLEIHQIRRTIAHLIQRRQFRRVCANEGELPVGVDRRDVERLLVRLDLIDRYAQLREAFVRSNPAILEIADPPSSQTLKNANTFWIEAGAMSGGSRNQVEFNKELAAFFGPVLNRQRKLAIDIGRLAWNDRPLSPKVTTFGVEIWRLSLPTASSGGFEYQGKVIRFRRGAPPSQRLVVDVANPDSRAARIWRSESNRAGYLGTTSGNRAFGFF
jgi:hypothetical protein